MAEVHLKLPASEQDVRKLRAGDIVYLTGLLFTARDEAHLRALEWNHEGKELPVKFTDGALYHCGPIMKKEGELWKIVAAGPTTSSRMNSLVPQFLEKIGARLIIGKGGMNKGVGEAMKKFGVAYLAFTGGAAVLAARRVREVKGVHWLDLGMPEAVWVLDAEEFGPLTVGMDSAGNSLFEDVAKQVEKNTAEARKRLVRRDDRLALLFAPPFDKTALEPGYIKGYPPGVRENGGQYTHAAIWVAMAFARRGEGGRAVDLFDMLNPIGRATTPSAVERYKVEPYVVAADVYAASGHVGRGGWTWYTGSAGWLYRSGIEWILGIRKEGDRLRLDPRIPEDWPGFKATLRHGHSIYDIVVDRAGAAPAGVIVDGADAKMPIELVDDGKRHEVRMALSDAVAEPRKRFASGN